ncbi:hypothetical protein F5X99DRAFT_378348 [Biscogniauxia marginata]|nr:hypothetical protein F5X99DRAFT_378348 [Biscogniauxia marginata]
MHLLTYLLTYLPTYVPTSYQHQHPCSAQPAAMSSKRKFADFNADSSETVRSRDRTPGHRPPKKSKKKNGVDLKTKPENLGWLKKRARTIERRFQSGRNLPANVQNELERELAHHQQKIAEIEDEKKKKLMIAKYHMVRFHERKKADRLAKQIQTQLKAATDDEEIEKLRADLHIAQVDGLYARYFPHRERYVSLYPAPSQDASEKGERVENASSAALALHRERPPLWAAIEKASKQGVSALTEIRERKLAANSRSNPDKERASGVSSATKADHPKAKRSFASDAADSRRGKGKLQEPLSRDNDGGSDSDGGFFEEEK